MRLARGAARDLRRVLLVVALVALLVGVGNRPAPVAEHTPQLDVLIAVDRTTSMSALDDPAGSRMQAVRRDLIELVEGLDGARVGVLTFGREATLELPLTSDLRAAENAVRGLQVEPAAAGAGSTLDRPVPLLVSELNKSKGSPGDRVAVVVLVTDGEATASSRISAYGNVGKRVQAAAVLGYGTKQGGVMPVLRLEADGSNAAEVAAGPLITTVDGTAAVSHLDPGNLKEIAKELGGDYVPADGKQDVATLAEELRTAAYADLPPTDPERELRWWWALVLLVLVLPELMLGWRLYVEARREGRA